MDISINSLIEGANFSDACCSACHAAGAYYTTVKHSVQFLSPVFKVWCFSDIWEPGLLLMIPAGVVAVSVSWHRTCIRCPCRPRGMQPSLPCGPGVADRAYAGTCTVCRKQAPGGPDMPVAGRRVCPGMRGPANAGRSRRCPAPSVWLCMPPHTRRNGMPKALPLVPICRACRVCGLVLAGSRTGVPVGVSRFGPFVPCPGVCWGVGGRLRLCSGMRKREGARCGVPSL